jgi:hypothetical protein
MSQQSHSKYTNELEVLAKNLSGLTRKAFRALPAYERAKWREQARERLGEFPTARPASRWIYVLSHPSWPGFSKIGECTNVRTRLAAYNTGCPTKSYRLEIAEYFDNTRILIQEIYEEFATVRTHGEWFAVDPHEVIPIIEAHKLNAAI